MGLGKREASRGVIADAGGCRLLMDEETAGALTSEVLLQAWVTTKLVSVELRQLLSPLPWEVVGHTARLEDSVDAQSIMFISVSVSRCMWLPEERREWACIVWPSQSSAVSLSFHWSSVVVGVRGMAAKPWDCVGWDKGRKHRGLALCIAS